MRPACALLLLLPAPTTAATPTASPSATNCFKAGTAATATTPAGGPYVGECRNAAGATLGWRQKGTVTAAECLTAAQGCTDAAAYSWKKDGTQCTLYAAGATAPACVLAGYATGGGAAVSPFTITKGAGGTIGDAVATCYPGTACSTATAANNATNATTSDDDDKVACVSLDSPVVVKGRGEVPLRELQFGDDVQDSAAGTYSPFVAWLDRSEDVTDFLELRHETGVLSITPGHLLKLDGAFDAARYARAGRMLGSSTILSVTASRRAGFAAPLTRSGTIVVAGSEISCYHEAPGAWGSADAVHQLANAGFLPLRWGLPVDGATYANALGGINSAITSFVKFTGADLHLYARTLIGGSSFM